MGTTYVINRDETRYQLGAYIQDTTEIVMWHNTALSDFNKIQDGELFDIFV